MFRHKKLSLSQDVIRLLENAKKSNWQGFRTESAIADEILRRELTKKTDLERVAAAAGKIN